MTFRKKSIVLGVGLAALGILAGAAILNRRAIQLEWWRWQAARDARSAGFSPKKPTPAWKKLFDCGEEGIPILASLLKDTSTWKAACETIDQAFQNNMEDREGFTRFLRSSDPLAHFLYLFKEPGPPESETEWRIDDQDSFNVTFNSWYRYWSGREAEFLEPNARGIDFLERHFAACDLRLRYRGINALSAMIRPGTVSKPEGPLAARVLDLLAEIARRDPDPDVRLHAISRMMMRASPTTKRLPTLEGWRQDLDRPIGQHHGDAENPFARESILALAYLDQPEALRFLIKLQKLNNVQAMVTEILASKPTLGPLAMPAWLPLGDSIRRFLRRNSIERVGAALVTAEDDLKEARPAIAEALEREPDGDVRSFLRGSLLVLGDESARPAVQRAFRERFLSWNGAMEESARVAEVHGRYLMRPIDLANLLLLSGDRPTLDLAFADLRKLPILLWNYIEGFPGELMDSISDDMDAADARKLAAWWEANQGRLEWDPAKRKFTLKP